MRVTDWKAAFEELRRTALEPDARVMAEQIIIAHTREVPDWRDRFRRHVEEAACLGWNNMFNGQDCGCDPCLDRAACATLDVDAEAIRIRRAVEESGCFQDLIRREAGGFSISFRVGRCLMSLSGDTMDATYRAAYDALMKAGKVTP